MNSGAEESRCSKDIEYIYLKGAHGETYHTKEMVHAYLENCSETIVVKCSEAPLLEAATSESGSQYVRSRNFRTEIDPLLTLPRV